MTLDAIFQLFKTAQFGAYVMSLDQKIVFWNEGAERILGFPRDHVIGRRCYEVVTGLSPGGFTPECLLGCPSLRSLRGGEIPRAFTMLMLCESGERKAVSLTPMVIAAPGEDAPFLVHLFDEPAEDQGADAAADSLRSELREQGASILSDQPPMDSPSSDLGRLTRRELEVLRLVAAGWGTHRIAEALSISPHTVRNHVRHFRGKLNATTKLDAVVTAIRLGIL